MSNDTMVVDQGFQNHNLASSGYLLKTFLKIGVVSFGGHFALLAMAKRQIVDVDKKTDDGLFVNAITLASLLPGPMAVNAVTYIGYLLNKKRGALASLLGIVFPASVIMMGASWLYFDYGHVVRLNDLLTYVAGVVCAVIASVGYNTYKKDIHGSLPRVIFMFVIFFITCAASSYALTLLIIVIGLFAGVLDTVGRAQKPNEEKNLLKPEVRLTWRVGFAIIILLAIQLSFFLDAQSFFVDEYAKIAIVFSGMSLSLFGGGYVMIPVMQSLFVAKLHWLNAQEFVDAIALSQMTPGPILVSATFIGYKVGGLIGALVATVCVFGPPAMLITVVSRMLLTVRNQFVLRAALDGAKVVIAGMMFSSVYKLTEANQFNLTSILIAFVSMFLIQKYKVSAVWLVFAAMFLGLIKMNYL
jgi:chromate transporter